MLLKYFRIVHHSLNTRVLRHLPSLRCGQPVWRGGVMGRISGETAPRCGRCPYRIRLQFTTLVSDASPYRLLIYPPSAIT
jgi:hypothetical protein